MRFMNVNVGHHGASWHPEEAAARRMLRLLVGIFTGLLWIDNLTEHYRGAFKIRAMWIPIILNPIAAVVGVLAALSPRRIWQRWFLTLSMVQSVVACVGFWYHQRGIFKRVGHGWRMYVFHAWYGPPALAPLQYLGFSVLGLLATVPRRTLAPLLGILSLPRLLRLFVALNVPPLWTEIAYLHWRGAFQDPFQWVPVVTIPVVGAASAVAAVTEDETARRVHQGLSWWMVALGVVGTGFHLLGLGRRYRGYSPQALLFNWLSGPPVPAPLQLIGLGLAALIGERARRSTT